jgi:hypothetical protein
VMLPDQPHRTSDLVKNAWTSSGVSGSPRSL